MTENGALDLARSTEHAKYLRTYAAQPNYKMKSTRMQDACNDLTALPQRGSYLDVACGRGGMLDAAQALGFGPVQGCEIVPDLIDGARVVYGEVHALPFEDNSFDVVTMFDVIEHLIPGDDERACLELMRVARRHVLLTANNKHSRNAAGDELHINRRPYARWHKLFRRWFKPCRVTWLRGDRHYVSEAWRIDLA